MEINIVDKLKTKTYIIDLNSKVLYDGNGSFQEVLEKAVKEKIELPNADLRKKELNEEIIVSEHSRHK